MQAPPLLADEGYPAWSLSALRNSGLVIVAVRERAPGISDYAVLEMAWAEKRIVLTLDKGFGEWVVYRRIYPCVGVVLFRLFDAHHSVYTERFKAILNAGIPLKNRFTTIKLDKVQRIQILSS